MGSSKNAVYVSNSRGNSMPIISSEKNAIKRTVAMGSYCLPPAGSSYAYSLCYKRRKQYGESDRGGVIGGPG